LPPVRDRQGDVTLLVNSFLKRFNDAYQKNILGISPECINRLESYDWPGNVREIRNMIHRSVVMCSGEVLLSEHLPKKLLSDSPHQPEIRIRIGATLQETEKQLIEQTLLWTNNNRSRTAKILGLSRRALYNKIERYGL
jgi:transcriptional regulator with PAS, ATPase and Fis domain